MNRFNLFDIFKDNKCIKITIIINKKEISLKKYHDTYYEIYINNKLKLKDISIFDAVNNFIKCLETEDKANC